MTFEIKKGNFLNRCIFYVLYNVAQAYPRASWAFDCGPHKKVTLKYLNAKSLTEFKSLSSHNLLSYNDNLANITIKANLHKKRYQLI